MTNPIPSLSDAVTSVYGATGQGVREGAGEDDLLAHGVSAIVIFRDGPHLSDRAGACIETLSGRIPVFDISPDRS